MTGYREGVIKRNGSEAGGHFIQWESEAGDRFNPGEAREVLDDEAAVALAWKLNHTVMRGTDHMSSVPVARMVLDEAAYDETPLGMCEGCEEPFHADDLSDQCGCGDDGSGQYVEDLNQFLCEGCHEAFHEPLEVD